MKVTTSQLMLVYLVYEPFALCVRAQYVSQYITYLR